MRFAPWIAPVALLLAACQQPADPDNAAPAEVANATSAPAVVSVPTTTTAFPPRFRGRWGLTRADCDPARADNKGLMRIEPAIVRFYESRGTPLAIDRETPGTIFATLAMNGEGQAWTDKTRFTLGNEGWTMLRASDQDEPPLLYTKCG